MPKGKVVWVTGSSYGIGRVVAHRLATQGACVAINCRKDLGRARRVVADIENRGGRAVLVRGDTAAPGDATDMHR